MQHEGTWRPKLGQVALGKERGGWSVRSLESQSAQVMVSACIWGNEIGRRVDEDCMGQLSRRWNSGRERMQKREQVWGVSLAEMMSSILDMWNQTYSCDIQMEMITRELDQRVWSTGENLVEIQVWESSTEMITESHICLWTIPTPEGSEITFACSQPCF